jgi:Zn-dependent peptidase ImmA (M78 family)
MTVVKAERVVGEILDACSVSAPPVPVEEIARKLGARVAFEHFAPDVSGVLVRDARAIVIGVNAAHPKTRQRFTIAHEIGHLRLHQGRPMFVDRAVRVDRRDGTASRGIDAEEIAANRFAAELLMPEEMVLEAVGQVAVPGDRGGSAAIIARLAEKFDVSEQAMEYRLANLGLVMPPG